MHKQIQRRHIARLLPIVALLASAGIHAHAAGQPADPAVAELRAELARIQAENARLREALAVQSGATAPAPALVPGRGARPHRLRPRRRPRLLAR